MLWPGFIYKFFLSLFIVVHINGCLGSSRQRSTSTAVDTPPRIASSTEKKGVPDTDEQGMKTISFRQGRLERSYDLFVPAKLAAERGVVLVMVFHGGGGRGTGMAKTTEMNALASAQGFIVVYGNGTGRGDKLSWNSGADKAQGFAERRNIDDIGYVREILRQLREKYPIDARRIYATGFSKGAMFTYRLGCELADELAAIATVSGPLTYTRCAPSMPLALMHVHGAVDSRVPFGGSAGIYHTSRIDWPSSMDGIERWSQFNHCSNRNIKVASSPGVESRHYQGCRADVEYHLVDDNGHAWPGSRPKQWQLENNEPVSQQFPASEQIWRFFDSHHK